MKIIYSITLVFFAWSPANANNQSADAHLFKAAYIYNFAKFTRWPNLTKNNQTINLCTAGKDDLVGELKRLEGKIIKGRNFLVTNLGKEYQLSFCQLLYVAASKKNQMRDILNEVKGLPILTISALSEFEKNGGMVQLYTKKNKTQIIINLSRVRDESLEISSRLLVLAKVIGNEKNQ